MAKTPKPCTDDPRSFTSKKEAVAVAVASASATAASVQRPGAKDPNVPRETSETPSQQQQQQQQLHSGAISISSGDAIDAFAGGKSERRRDRRRPYWRRGRNRKSEKSSGGGGDDDGGGKSKETTGAPGAVGAAAPSETTTKEEKKKKKRGAAPDRAGNTERSKLDASADKSSPLSGAAAPEALHGAETSLSNTSSNTCDKNRGGYSGEDPTQQRQRQQLTKKKGKKKIQHRKGQAGEAACATVAAAGQSRAFTQTIEGEGVAEEHRTAAPAPSAISSTITATSLERFSVCGFPVTMIDRSAKVFVIDLVQPETCDTIRRLTEAHVRSLEGVGRSGGGGGGGDAGFRSLYSYTKLDLPAREVPGLPQICFGIAIDVCKVCADVLGRPRAAFELCPRSWKEPHLLKYQNLPGKESHTGIRMHYDGGDLTWSLMLSDADEYTGGGTYFRLLRGTVRLRKGQVLVHPGNLFHAGVDIESGTRDLVVCFMDGCDLGVKDTSTARDDRGEFQKNVIEL